MLLDRYIGWVVLRAFVLIAGGLTALFSLLILIEQLALVGQGRYQVSDAFIYTLLTTPDRLLLLTPICMLLAALLGLGGLARRSELTAMSSFGFSEARIIGAVLKLCVPVVAALFLMAQFVIPPAQLRAQRVQASALGNTVPGLANGGFWARQGGTFLNVKQFSGGDTLRGISVFDLAQDSTLRSFMQAREARIEPDGSWLLRDILRKKVDNGLVSTDAPAQLYWHPFLSTRQLRLLAMPPQTMPPLALLAYVRELKREHSPALFYEESFWTMVAIPVSLFGMALIATPFVFGAERSGGAGRQMMIGGMIGIGFLLIQQITAYLGLILALNPVISGLAPSVLLLISGLYTLAERDTPDGKKSLLQKAGIGAVLRPQ